jgi:hypothetical protein
MFDKDNLQFPLFAALLKWSFKLYTFMVIYRKFLEFRFIPKCNSVK